MKKKKRILPNCLALLVAVTMLSSSAMAANGGVGTNDMWIVANDSIVDVYTHIVGISTVLATLTPNAASG